MGNGAAAASSSATGNPTHSKNVSDIRIALIGKTGTGKSTLGNAILGNKMFGTSGLQMESTTVSYEVGTVEVGDKRIFVLDTPGVMGMNKIQENLQEELSKFIFKNLMPGPHVFVLTIRADARFTEEEAKAVKIFTDLFGDALYSHLVVVFTHKSALDKYNKTVDDCLRKLPNDFIAKFREYEGHYIAIEIEDEMKHAKKEVRKLLKVVQEVVDRNIENYYKEEMMKEDEEARKARISEIKQANEKRIHERLNVEARKKIKIKQQVMGNIIPGAALIADVSEDAIDDSTPSDKGKKAFGKGLMGAANIASKAGTNEIGDLVNTEDLGEGGEFLEGAAKIATKTAVKTAAKQLKDKDEKKSDHDKEATGNKDNIKAATKVATKLTSVAIDAETD